MGGSGTIANIGKVVNIGMKDVSTHVASHKAKVSRSTKNDAVRETDWVRVKEKRGRTNPACSSLPAPLLWADTSNHKDADNSQP